MHFLKNENSKILEWSDALVGNAKASFEHERFDGCEPRQRGVIDVMLSKNGQGL